MGTPTTIQNVDDRGYVFVTEAADCQMLASKVTVTSTTPIKVPQDTAGDPRNLPARRRVYVKNNNASGGNPVYVGDAAITTTTVLDITDDIQLYAVVASSHSVDLRIMELS